MTSVSAQTSRGERAAARRGSAQRSGVLDGLKGLSIVLVILFHSWKVWPAEERPGLGPFEFLFQSGNVAVTIFFVISGFLVTRALVRARAHGPLAPLTWFLRRVARLSIQVWVLLAAVYVVSRIDPTDTMPADRTVTSLVRAGTYTWNTYVRDHALEARSDIGALYFLSIDVQFFAVFVLLFLILSRAPRVLTAVVVVGLVGATTWRWLEFSRDGWFNAALSTPSRMDALLWGCLAALALPWLTSRWGRGTPTALVGAALLPLGATVVSTSFYGVDTYFGVQGVVAAASTAGLVAADALSRHSGWARRLLSQRRLTALGRASLTLFLWHIPVFELVARHTPAWSSAPRVLASLLLLAGVTVLVERIVARPVIRLFARHRTA